MKKSKIIKQKSRRVVALRVRTESNTLGAMKTTIVLLLIVLQFVGLVLSYLYLTTVFSWFSGFSLIMSLATSIYVLSSNKSGQNKATWILFLLVCFTFGYFIFFISDEHILFAKSKKKYKRIYSQTEQFIDTQIEDIKVPSEIKLNCDYLKTAGNFPTYYAENIKYFPSGAELFDDMIENFKQAKKFIFIEFYIFSEGTLLARMLDILKERISNGVEVRIIYDDMGSHHTISLSTKKIMKQYGIKIQPFNRLVPIFNFGLNYRDHRKIVIIDGEISYTGGANLSDEYINEKRMHGYWKDSGVKIQGSASNTFTIAFLRQWEFLTNNKQDYKKYLNNNINISGNSLITPYVSGPDYPKPIARDVYINMISQAKERIYIMTPYFVPDETMIDLLKVKALSGVDVKIILPGVADKRFVYTISRNYAERLIDYGVKLYVMKHSFVHSKLMISDESGIVGSINLDQRSFYQQFESAIFSNNSEFLSDLENDFNYVFSKCEEITDKNKKSRKILNRFFASIFRIISPFM